ncbi:MAG: ATP-dependent RecD-like DNA helicase [Gammaproteobacteria bacterium]
MYRASHNPDTPLAERLCGSIERVTFHSEESGFCVLRVKVRGRRDLATVVGTAATVTPGEYVEGEGSWVTDRTHGLQFKAHQLSIVPPNTLEGIEKYLGSGMIRGIGPHFARKLVRAFGEQVFDIIEQQPAKLEQLPGIGPKRMQRVVAAWREQKVVREIMVFLRSYGVGTARAVRIYRTYGAEAIDRVRENPYRLALDIHGMGFLTADTLAQRLGIGKDSLMRAQAGLRHVLQELSAEGHCAAERERVIETAARMLTIPVPILEQGIREELAAGDLVAETIDGEPCIFLKSLHRAEVGVGQHLLRLLPGAPPWGSIDADKAMAWVEKATGLTLSASQRHAVATAINGKLTVITGGPGVGKTTVVNSILRIVRAKGIRVVLCAPTGRAAKRLSESTGVEAKTIHRLLEFDPHQGRFSRSQENPLDAEFLIIDELSMVDVALMNQLLRALIDRAALLMVGDIDQLPSVGPGAVLADIIDSGRIPTVRLREIFRQAARSRIIANAHRINRGEMPERPTASDGDSDFYFIATDTPEAIHHRLLQLVTERIPARFGLHPIRDVQVMCPMNRGLLGTRSLNAELQRRLNAHAQPTVNRYGWTFAPGDKVIQTVNNYQKEVFNGDIGRITRIDSEEGVVSIEVDGREIGYELAELDEIALAYAITVHKSQGSEYPAVVIPLAMQHYLLLERNLLYTGVTRGKQLVVIVGQVKALAMAVSRAQSRRRLTNLVARIKGLASPP